MEYRLGLTPQTVIVDDKGKVLDVRTGLLSKDDLAALTASFTSDGVAADRRTGTDQP